MLNHLRRLTLRLCYYVVYCESQAIGSDLDSDRHCYFCMGLTQKLLFNEVVHNFNFSQ